MMATVVFDDVMERLRETHRSASEAADHKRYNRGVENGERIEIVGFVAKGHATYAVWRDDDGRLYDIPAHLLLVSARSAEAKRTIWTGGERIPCPRCKGTGRA